MLTVYGGRRVLSTPCRLKMRQLYSKLSLEILADDREVKLWDEGQKVAYRDMSQ
jgi:hypothetical protein